MGGRRSRGGLGRRDRSMKRAKRRWSDRLKGILRDSDIGDARLTRDRIIRVGFIERNLAPGAAEAEWRVRWY